MKLFLTPIFLFAVAGWGFFGYLVWFVPPEIEEHLALSNIVYAIISGGAALGFSVSLVHYFFALFFKPKLRSMPTGSQERKTLLQSLRRGFLFSITLSGVIALNVFDLLNLLNAGLLIGIAILAEIYFSSR